MIFRDILPPKKQEKKPDSALSEVFIGGEKDAGGISRTRELFYILVAAFLVLFAITTVQLGNKGLRLKKNIVEAAQIGYAKILSATLELKDANYEKAKLLFNEASAVFNNIENETWFATPRLPTLKMRDPTFEAGAALIETGQYLAKAGSSFTQIAAEINITPSAIFEANRNILAGPTGFAGSTTKNLPSLTEKLKKQIPAVLETVADLDRANAAIKGIPASFIPANLRENFNFGKNALSALTETLKNINQDLPAILELLGDAHPHTFLILLQNNAEIRPTGGFIGNYMLAETNDGYLTKLEIFDVYGADHELAEVITPPEEIAHINDRWYLRDSNYSGHFPLSAEKAAWFLEKEGGPGVDSIIAIDQSIITELLYLTGPIKIPELGKPLTGGNFTNIISYIVEAKLSGRQDPKAILRDFLPAFEKAIFKYVSPVSLLPLMQSQITGKHLFAYSKNEAVQEFFKRHDTAGLIKIPAAQEDYLNIVHTSVSANKSDAYIQETVGHDTYLRLDGSVIDELTITREHLWTVKTERELKTLVSSFGLPPISQDVIPLLGGAANIHLLRIYVPNGTTLEPIDEQSGDKSVALKFDEEIGLAYFSATIKTKIGEKTTLKIRYKLPFKLDIDPVDKYVLTVQKQAGQENTTIVKRVFPDSGVLNYKYFPETGSFDTGGVLHHEGVLTEDTSFTSIWGKPVISLF